MPPTPLTTTIASVLGVADATPSQPVWELIQEIDEFVDYEYYLPDVNGLGMRLRITLNLDDYEASLNLIGDTEDGDQQFERTDIRIPWDYALQVTNHSFE